MIAVVQIVKSAKIIADGEFSGECGKGLYILLGVEDTDSTVDADLLSAKIKKLRIFKDQNDKMNLSVLDIQGECAVVSNFTLCANYRFISKMEEEIPHVAHGRFGSDMQTEMITDGPVTIVLQSSVLKK